MSVACFFFFSCLFSPHICGAECGTFPTCLATNTLRLELLKGPNSTSAATHSLHSLHERRTFHCPLMSLHVAFRSSEVHCCRLELHTLRHLTRMRAKTKLKPLLLLMLFAVDLSSRTQSVSLEAFFTSVSCAASFFHLAQTRRFFFKLHAHSLLRVTPPAPPTHCNWLLPKTNPVRYFPMSL